MNIPFEPTDVATRLLAWYGRHGRELPWRQTRDPYRIWLSEIMLQQTTVTAAIPYYENFLKRFPDVRSLAAADQEAVLELWSGLGYYSRARNLHKAAQQVVSECRGQFPETVEGLMGLPGVGRSTAGAIVSIAFDRAAPILDGNVRRVLVRLMALQKPPRERASEKLLWQWAEALTSEERPHDYAQAIMDLGATVCTPRQPACQSCPLNGICVAKKKGLAQSLPLTTKSAKLPVRHQLVLVVEKGDRQLIRRRPASGLLGGMWEFPCLEVNEKDAGESLVQQLVRECSARSEVRRIGSVKHLYSHFRLEATVYRAAAAETVEIADNETFWHDVDMLAASPLHGAHQKALKLILEETDI